MQRKTGFLRVGFMLAMSMAAAAQAQDAAEIDAVEPAVDTSAFIDEAEPAVDTSSIAAEEAAEQRDVDDITRRSTTTGVMDEIELGRTEVTGNQELPKVLYIVPWQKADPGDLMGRPVNTLLDEVLAPLNRDEFVRQIDYYDDLYGEPGE